MENITHSCWWNIVDQYSSWLFQVIFPLVDNIVNLNAEEATLD